MTMKTKTSTMILSYLETVLSLIAENSLLQARKKKNGNDIEDIEGINFENTLCTAWDLATVSKYAYVMQEKYKISSHLIRIITKSKENRTRELSLGILANLARHEDVGLRLMKDNSVLLLCRSLLRKERQDKILLETTRILNAFFTCATSSFPISCSTFINVKKDQQQQLSKTYSSIIAKYNYLNLFLISNDELQPSIYHRYTQIIINTLNSDLLYESLQLIISITIYIHGITLSSLSSLPLSSPTYYYGDQSEKNERKKLVHWAIGRLNKEINNIGSEAGLNNAIVKSTLCLVWTFLFYNLLGDPSQYMTNLDPILSTITCYLQQQTESGKDSDEQDIEFIVNALHDINNSQ